MTASKVGRQAGRQLSVSLYRLQGLIVLLTVSVAIE